MLTDTATIVEPSLWPEFRATFLAWERLRIVYNVVLVALTCISVLGSQPQHGLDPGFWLSAVVAGLAANVCYFLGPVAACYLRWLGVRSAMLTPLLFGLGLAFSMLITFAMAAIVLVSSQN